MYVKVEMDLIEILNEYILFIVYEQNISDDSHQVTIYLRDSKQQYSKVIQGYINDFTLKSTEHLFLGEQEVETLQTIFDKLLTNEPKHQRRLGSVFKKIKRKLI
jgi:hypothetical protein